MHVFFVFVSVLMALIFLCLLGLSVNAAFVKEKAAWEPFQCTIPSGQLLIPDSGEPPRGTLNSVIAGSSVFVEGVFSYLNCLSRTAAHDSVVGGRVMIDAFRSMFGAGKKKADVPAAPSQPQPPQP